MAGSGKSVWRSLCALILALAGPPSALPTPEQAGSGTPADEGAEEFVARWGVVFSLPQRWGRGPTSNAEACADCHAQAGRGRPPTDGEPARSLGLRLSLPSPEGVPLPHPAYGAQLQTQGILGEVPAEGSFTVAWTEHVEQLAGGERVWLRRPSLRVLDLAFGPLGEATLHSLRLAPPLRGLGLLEAVPAHFILQQEQAQASRGLRGRASRLPGTGAGPPRLGRFGHKADQGSLEEQVAAAYWEELGVTSRQFPRQNCPPVQRACGAAVAPAQPELSPARLGALLAYLRALLPPPPAADLQGRGAALFIATGCSGCHRPELVLAPATVAAPLRPYTDLLLHDLGSALDDGRPEFSAQGAQWRTAPLWGLGLAQAVDRNPFFLHDGRARSIMEAILWHGGEAAAAREAFRRLEKPERERLCDFVGSR